MLVTHMMALWLEVPMLRWQRLPKSSQSFNQFILGQQNGRFTSSSTKVIQSKKVILFTLVKKEHFRWVPFSGVRETRSVLILTYGSLHLRSDFKTHNKYYLVPWMIPLGHEGWCYYTRVRKSLAAVHSTNILSNLVLPYRRILFLYTDA